MNSGITADLQNKITKLIEIFFPEAKIYLFGSRARGDFHERSDIDIAIDDGKPLPLTQHGEVISMMEALNTVYQIDIVDFRSIPEKMQKKITTEGIMWKK